ncbi:hypothetical protein [Aquitalea magnusonii]|uniref:hypothetical protein n=1 Tax=Aquitalea magnusonii TaxID=332411 RepID=UPI000B7AF2CD|nr:hypothetical protein [Aquitalea magnusonii]
MSTVSFCKGWFRAKKLSLEAYTYEQAQALHLKGELYCALIGPVASPTCFLEIKHGFVGVGFLDEALREYLTYAFQEKQPGKLFLSMATWREFEGNSDKVSKGTAYLFQPDGTLTISREGFVPVHSLETSSSSADVSGNWEHFPDFGRYEHFTRAER